MGGTHQGGRGEHGLRGEKANLNVFHALKDEDFYS